MYFDSIQSFQGALNPQQQEIEDQIPKFTNITPFVQMSMVHTPITEDLTIDKNPSRTAAFTAYCRALAAHDERTEIKGPDSLAELFVPEEMKRSFFNKETIKNSTQMLSSFYGLLIARTSFFDNLFKNALIENIPQIVFLGAGYDTRAFRFKDSVGTTTIFELDTPPTQKRKLAILSKADIDIPKNLKQLSVNLKTDNFDQ